MKLLSFMKSYSSRGGIALAFLAAAASGAASTGFPALIVSALNTEDLRGASRLGWAFLGVCLLVPGTRLLSQYLLFRLVQDAARKLRLDFSRQLLAAPLRQQESLGEHRLMAAVSEDLPALTGGLSMVPHICTNIALMLGCLAYLGVLSLPLLGIVVILVVAGSYATRLPMKIGERQLTLARSEADNFYRQFRSVARGAKEIKSHRWRREALMSRIETVVGKLRRLAISARMIFNLSASVGQLLFFFVVGLLLFVVTRYQSIERDVLIGYTVVLFFMKSPLQGLVETLPALSQVDVAISKLEALGLSLKGGDEDLEPDACAAPESWRRVELQAVSHAYHREDLDDVFTLGPIDLSFEPGELVFLVGGNGSGKTTLAKLLVGVYAPHSGAVWFDGEEVTAATRDRYRQLFSVVYSDFFLFDSLLGLEIKDLDQRAARYLSKLHLDRKVEVKEGVLSTTELSQGQRKRLALLTAYLEDRSIYVFDEWAADQDPIFKEVFYLQLLPELKASGKTVFVISHDDHYYHVADRLVKLENGKIEFDRLLNQAAQRAVDDQRISK